MKFVKKGFESHSAMNQCDLSSCPSPPLDTAWEGAHGVEQHMKFCLFHDHGAQASDAWTAIREIESVAAYNSGTTIALKNPRPLRVLPT